MINQMSFDRLPSAVAEISDRLSRIEMLLTKPAEPAKPQRFDLIGALNYLNGLCYKTSKSQMQKLTASGRIPCKKFNNKLVFERNELDAWVEAQTVTVDNNSDKAALTLAASANHKLRKAR